MSTSQTAGSGTSNNSSNSASGLVSTLVPVAASAALFFSVFLILRAKKSRVYRPRTYLPILNENERTTKLPDGKFSWLAPFRKIPDEHVLNHQSLDGYLYLRYLKLLTIISFVGCLITWPVLLPVNATGGGGQTQLDLLSFSNIANKNRYYAHVFIAWIYFGFVMYMITRETIYFINLRHVYLLAPFNAAKISSRTVVFTWVPEEYLNVERLKNLLGSSVHQVWFSTDCQDLSDKVDERDDFAMKLENGAIKVIKAANDRRLKWEKKCAKAEKKGKPQPPSPAHNPEQPSPWMEVKDRPTHRKGKIPLIGGKVDTIDSSRNGLRQVTEEVQRLQDSETNLEGTKLPVVFVQFATQSAADSAFRKMTPKKPPHMNPAAISVTPSEIVWKNLKIKKMERRLRIIGTSIFLSLMILFWSIPVAVIGAISNINYLVANVPFLSFIDNIPSVILGVVTGLLPSILLSVLMALVPIVCRFMAKLSGEISLPAVELKCQNWYFAFQVIQVFLVSTFSSGAASVASQIVDNPSSATTLLARNLPKASNFFISYIIVQGLGIAAGNLLNIGSLAMITVVGKFLDKSPRKMYKRYITLAGLGWGSLYPKFGCLGVIAIAYSCIAPLVLGFATIGFLIVYLAVRYNMFYVLSNNIDTKGHSYGKALQQLTVGVYIAEVCLLGLFAINTAPGPIVLMAVCLAFTAIYHLVMRHALKPLTMYLPESLEGEDQLAMFSTEENKSWDVTESTLPPTESHQSETPLRQSKKAAFLGKLFNPKKFKSHGQVKNLIGNHHTPPVYEDETAGTAYFHPAIVSEAPILWIPRDEMGISTKMIEKWKEDTIRASDNHSRFNEKGKVVWDENSVLEAPIRKERVDY